MQRLQAFKFALMPNGDQARDLRRFAGSCRFVFNKALAMQQERHAAGDKKLGYADLCKALIAWKADPATAWLCDTPSQALQQSLKDLDRAYTNFFAKRADAPRFKKKGRSGDSFRYPQGVKLDQANNRLFLPKLGWLRYRNSREVLGTVKTSPSASQAASGSPRSRPNGRSRSRCIRGRRSGSMWALPASPP
ncbi:transposase [uncultured Thiocystis sp.]|jgi:putative transposase|uniref:RNA-guided endonuclease InsQ/TnpB family protein n=1 Tax=uncultured Thiocystis sp. TaxID=1202134 RepID=UPI0025DB9131|nr:transposase [uncultured Thiocystis sp.]